MIRAVQSRKPPVLAAIDGRCGGGKTTLAGELSRRFGWNVVHMDDFFLRPEQRTEERYRTPGGNVDHERFLEEVLRPLRHGGEVRYRPFDCAALALSGVVELPKAAVTVVEGSYACHPALWEWYDFHVFVDISPEEQRNRILIRNGPVKAEQFRQRWIPMEEAYFSAFSIRERCEFVLCWPEDGEFP